MLLLEDWCECRGQCWCKLHDEWLEVTAAQVQHRDQQCNQHSQQEVQDGDDYCKGRQSTLSVVMCDQDM